MSKPILRLDTTPPAEKQAVIDQLLEKGHIETCLVCDKLSAYAWCDTDEDLGVECITVSSGWEWQCGHCRAHHIRADSPLLHPAYTHAED